MATFAAVLTFIDDIERRLEVRPRHREYLQELLAAGRLHESGPFADDSGALIVYEADNENMARQLLAGDPYTEAGVIADASLHEWKILFSGSTAEKSPSVP